MKATTTYKTFSVKGNWTISQMDFISNIENFWYNRKAGLKYADKKTQPPTEAQKQAGRKR